MDHRTTLKKGTAIEFSDLTVIVEKMLTYGSNGIIYQGWAGKKSEQKKLRVFFKELFPFDPKGGITRQQEGNLWIEDQSCFNRHRINFLKEVRLHWNIVMQDRKLPVELVAKEANNTLYELLICPKGKTLAEVLQERKMNLEEILKLIQAVLKKLKCYHERNCFHLNLHPENIILVEGDHRKGLFLFNGDAVDMPQTAPLLLVRQAGYSAPEINMGLTGQQGAGSDLYSVGAILYRCLAGETLRQEETFVSRYLLMKCARNMESQNEEAAELIQKILFKSLYTLPQKRYQNIGEMEQDLEELGDMISERKEEKKRSEDI